jgi:hypothetical protein
VDDDTAQALGRMAGAQIIISGAVSRIGDLYRLRVRALSVQDAQIAGQFNRNIPDGPTVSALAQSQATGYGGGSNYGGSGGTAVPASAAQAAPAAAQAPAATAVPADPDPQPAAPVEPPAPVVYKIGDKGPAGGWIFYDKGVVTNGWRYLEAAPNDVGPTQWGVNGTAVNGTSTAAGTGKANTQRIVPVLEQREEDGSALLCSMLNINGHTGWFLPSIDELDMMYKNLKQKGLGGFGNGFYWSSSESGNNYAWAQRFSDGNQVAAYNSASGKSNTYSVRAIRAF